MASLSAEMIETSCNWKISNAKELISCVTIVNPKQDVDFDDLVTLDSCISLSRDGLESTELPEITFKVRVQGFVISKMLIVSEGRLLELYGRCGEYQNTTKAEDSEAGDEEMKVYNARLRLATLSPECSVRFAGLGSGKTDMWLLGIGIVLTPSASVPNTSNIAARVDQILQASAFPLSANAEHCKRITMAQAVSPGHNMGRSLYDGISEEHIKKYVDVCCDKLETNLKLHVDQKFEALQSSINDKLDHIIKTLNK